MDTGSASIRSVPQQTTLGAEFARAFAAKDAGRMRELLHPEVDFAGLTPSRFWEASGPDAVLEVLFANWLDDSDEVRAVEAIEEDSVADRERVGYRFSVTNPDGRFVVEQQAYLSTRDGRIDWVRLVCSGFRPAP
jgi:SnoaL-like domain